MRLPIPAAKCAPYKILITAPALQRTCFEHVLMIVKWSWGKVHARRLPRRAIYPQTKHTRSHQQTVYNTVSSYLDIKIAGSTCTRPSKVISSYHGIVNSYGKRKKSKHKTQFRTGYLRTHKLQCLDILSMGSELQWQTRKESRN